jgi:putative membrane protein
MATMFKSTGFWQFTAVIGFLGFTFFNPHDFTTWFTENIAIVAAVAFLLWNWRKGIQPSPLLSWFLVLHAFVLIYGAWYTFSRAPLGDLWSDWFGWERNHYDRLAHLAQGFFPAVLIREVLSRNNVVNGVRWREFLVFACAMAFAAIFELLEFALSVGLGDGTLAFLGSQGDVWDAQWDMLWCGVGAIASMVLTFHRHEWELARLEARRPRVLTRRSGGIAASLR